MSNKISNKEIAELKKINYSKTIKLRVKRLSGGKLSLYLDYWNGKKREYQFLKIYLSNKVTNYQEDKNNLNIAISIRDKKQLELLQREGFELNNWKQEANYVDFFQTICKEKPATEKAWNNTLKHLRDYKEFIKIKNINENFVEDFKDYLLTKVSNNTAHTYLSKIKASLNEAVKKRIIFFNPATGFQIKKTQAKREFLALHELKKLNGSHLYNNDIKQAFLFSCFTGLRLGDCEALKFNQIEEGYLSYTQRKTKGNERIKLNKTALSIIEEQKALKETGTIFILPCNISDIIKKWVKENGINKKITFHCARHTFATMNLTAGNDIFTTSKLLGHRDVKVTQIYAKLIDRKKDEAVDRLPEL